MKAEDTKESLFTIDEQSLLIFNNKIWESFHKLLNRSFYRKLKIKDDKERSAEYLCKN